MLDRVVLWLTVLLFLVLCAVAIATLPHTPRLCSEDDSKHTTRLLKKDAMVEIISNPSVRPERIE